MPISLTINVTADDWDPRTVVAGLLANAERLPSFDEAVAYYLSEGVRVYCEWEAG